MKSLTRGFSAYIGLGAVIFVMLVGALGYNYVIKYKAEVATTNPSSKTIAAQTVVVEVKQTADLAAAADTLDSASVDALSDADLAALEAELNNF